MNAPELLHTTLALAAVLALVLLLAWLVQRLGGARKPGALALRGQLSLGAKERVVVVAWDGQEWLLGVAAGQVNLLACRDVADAAPESASAALTPALSQGERVKNPSLPQAFAAQLQQTLARWGAR